MSEQVTDRWSVLRSKTKNGAVSPIRLTFGQPMTEAQVRAYIEMEKDKKSEAYRQFKYFDIYPTP